MQVEKLLQVRKTHSRERNCVQEGTEVLQNASEFGHERLSKALQTSKTNAGK